MGDEEKIVITGIGPLTAGGSGKDEVWDAIMKRRTGLVRKNYSIDGENLGEFYLHEIKNFDINKYEIKKSILAEVEGWKMGDAIIDFYYFLAVIKMAIDDARLKIDDRAKYKIGFI